MGLLGEQTLWQRQSWKGFLKVVLELMDLKKKDRSTAWRSKVGSCIMLIKGLIKCKSDGKLVATREKKPRIKLLSG